MSPQSAGPIAFWRPVEGARHGMSGERLPRPGQERDALCGKRITITEPSVVDWLAPTCAECWTQAKKLRDSPRS
ncbi:zinc finger protein [Parasphingorhabdus pacifica]